ncbi:MAG TPA: A/G-specific adenine glycosylase [Acetobacteraceae bacterium]
MPPTAEIPSAAALLAWYDRHRRALPWRARPGEVADPYRIWLSEIMLQQTTVAAVIPYYESFLTRFPDVAALATAPEDAVMRAWAGLGYYARARNLHACAKAVAAQGGFPADLEGLRKLPGIGPYTAAAIGAIAFGLPAVPVDGNVERVVSRIFAIETPLPAAKPLIQAGAARLGEDAAARARPSDFAQALFDLGATICTTNRPVCSICPWMRPCAARQSGIAAELPRKAAKALRPLRHGVHFWLTDSQDRVLLRRRPSKGLLGGMTELPGTDWVAEKWDRAAAVSAAPMVAGWREIGEIRHGFTHFELRISVFSAAVPVIAAEGFLQNATQLEGEALPSVMRKCVALARKAG